MKKLMQNELKTYHNKVSVITVLLTSDFVIRIVFVIEKLAALLKNPLSVQFI